MRLVFNQPKTARHPAVDISLHWLPVAARIKFQTLTFAYKTATKTAPVYLNSLIQVYTPSPSLGPANERHLVPPSQQESLARLFSSAVPRWWNKLSNSVRSAESLLIFKKRLKTQFFCEHLCTSWTEGREKTKRQKFKKQNKTKKTCFFAIYALNASHCLVVLLSPD